MRLSFSIYAAALGAQLASSAPAIIGGQIAGDGAAPYIVSIRKNGSHNCGGTLIRRDVVLTAGHCLMDVVPRTLTVVAGSHSVKTGGVERNVSQGITNPDFDSIKRINDIALLKLAAPFDLTPAIQTVAPFPRQEVDAGTNVTAYGWGYSTWPGRTRPDELHFVQLSTITTAACNDAYRAYDGKNITDNQVCTGTGGRGTCQGDSGGPLVWVDGNNKTYQVGLTSFGVPCGNEYPDVFTKINPYQKWIEANSV
ncbi:chymotrypsin-like proteinase 5A precursor [Cordyceps fumosorosea ARSEF 2679]|uniref:Chymotrypsin-like proteinase 5A n=1 Tax=Cordyceps fumosorosea (strain ARSEF 2679) TaxID=1081104 RepID=A0A167TQR1_CORFA|nr:chymotrypsin-like proteinase 5A precursor [Cordyceps fumosorosea ARSEF 2679]OAA60848.1 chymotrypsin-like proteinase 5A precursor [Cordyceps fumosorosea ARSEF 2679]